MHVLYYRTFTQMYAIFVCMCLGIQLLMAAILLAAYLFLQILYPVSSDVCYPIRQ